MHTRIVDDISTLDREQWNALLLESYPFLRHEFLAALERHGCVGEKYGWLPRHLVVQDDAGQLLGAAPMYLKDNSYGEFVFDWGWADAYQRAGLAYYPKLVVAAPYTPATGPRLLVRRDADHQAVCTALIEGAIAHATEQNLSSLHWLFTNEQDTRQCQTHGLMRRTGCQFHWHNEAYTDFDDFLAGFSSRKRKKLRRERRHVSDAGIEIRVLHGHEASAEDWRAMHYFYRSTFERKSGIATLSLPFFEDISRSMGEQLVLVFAYLDGRPVAGAINLRSESTLYGRHWGCLADFNSLHFEVCYYTGIEYCIRHGLQRFEPGAQGEHKVGRGFRPTLTWSTHWIANDEFRRAVDDFLGREHRGMLDYMDSLMEQLPFKAAQPATDSRASETLAQLREKP